MLDIQKVALDGENLFTEFKSAQNIPYKLLVDKVAYELIALANAKGGTVYIGIEDGSGKITGVPKSFDGQRIIEQIYDKTIPPLFTDYTEYEHDGNRVIAITCEKDGTHYSLTDGRCARRLGKNSKPWYPAEMGRHYDEIQTPDFSSRLLKDSTINDIDQKEIFNLKSKIRARDPQSTLPDMENLALLKDLQLVKEDRGEIKLTIAGLLFAGKSESIEKFLPQAELIYLRYDQKNPDEYSYRLDLRLPILAALDKIMDQISYGNNITNIQVNLFRLEVKDYPENVIQEALLNALTHRDYQSNASVYVKQYPDRIIIENPGGFPEGITTENIITHSSVPRNKLIAETLQHLRYVQRTGQGVDTLPPN